jgi:N-acetylmuramoyl-L-alanine amidase
VALKPLPPAGAIVASAGAVVSESPEAIDVLARTMWGEARGEREGGMAAVAHVVLNRRDAGRWWGSTVEAVCHKPFQFSCWNEGDANRGKLLTVNVGNAEFALAMRTAKALLAMLPTDRARADTTNGATHYHVRGLTPLPNWARGKQPCQQLGRHVFYRGIA